MKPWIKLSIVVLITSSSAVWADIDFSQFDFKPFIHARKPKRPYPEELTKALPPDLPPVVEAKQAHKPRVMVAQAPSEHFCDCEQIVTVSLPVLPPQPVKVADEPKVDLDKAVVTANIWVEHHETGEVGLKLTECDRMIDEKYPSPPLVLECISKGEGTRYVAKSKRTARDGAYIWNYKTVTWQN